MHHHITKLLKPPDIIAISEAKLKQGHFQINIDLDGYNFVHVDSSTIAGVVGLYINDNQLHYEILDIYNIDMDRGAETRGDGGIYPPNNLTVSPPIVSVWSTSAYSSLARGAGGYSPPHWYVDQNAE